MTRKNRENGILFPISSLPGNYGIGSLGKEAYAFVDFLDECHVNIWQMLPLNVTSYGDSPYQSPSSKGLNYYFIDLDTLIHKGLLSETDVDSIHFSDDERRVNYGLLFENRVNLLKKAFNNFNHNDARFVSFEKEGFYRDFAFYMTMKELNHFTPWYKWENRDYSEQLEEEVIKNHHDLYLFYVWTQFEFLEEYHKLKDYANQKNIRLMGDMPLYLALDSVEAYKNPEMFRFDEKHNPTLVAGCPPDYFNEDGQLWGNPIYDWDYMKKNGYQWWNERIEYNLKLFDILRIDHFRGIAAYYTIPADAKNAKKGEWVKGPGIDLFEGKEDYPIIAEDLGFMDDMVRELLQKSGYPGMKVLEFAFDGQDDNEHKPSQAKYNYVCYTGTHDNDTIKGYLESLGKEEYKTFLKDLKKQCDLFAVEYHDKNVKEVTRTLDCLCYASPCRLAILPFADIAVFGSEARLNTPAILSGKNWTFRYLKSDFNEDVKSFLKDAIQKYNR
jgi:4-alpha-glucanotransferase